jgi:hypothetical protein
MGIHLPGFLEWGDVSLTAALSGKAITFVNPQTMSGKKIEGKTLQNYKTEFELLSAKSKQAGKAVFIKE